MTNRLSALISCAFILLQPFSPAFADPIASPDPVAVSPSTVGAPSPAPQVPSLASTVTPEIANLLAPATNQQQTILDVALTGGTINFTGDFVNKDNLYIISTSSQYLTANLFASGNIINAANASISTLIPTGVTGAISGLNLVLTAGANIINAGSISSAGSLVMNAGNSIINTVVPQAQPVIPVMQAQSDIAMQASNIINQGVIQSSLANINMATIANSLAINAIGGSFSAPGAINIVTPDIMNGGALDILGGDFISKSLNLQSGAINLAANSISGPLNLEAASAAVQCNSGNLVIGNFNVSGQSAPSFGSFAAFSSLSEEDDPTYIHNSEGDLIFIADTIAPSLNLSAGRDILNDGASTISTVSGLGLTAGNNINFAGLKSLSSESTVILTAGGSIDVSGVAVSAGTAGSIYLIADKHIVLDSTTLNSGYGGIKVIAGGDISGTSTVIDSSSAPGNPGAIFLASIGGAIDLGSKSVITTGKNAPDTVVVGPGAIYAISVNAYNGLNLGTVSAPSGEIVLGSGIQTIGNRFVGWVSKTLDGQNHLGSGGITAGDISIRTDGSLQNSRLIINPSNGNLTANSILGNGGLIVIPAPFDVTVVEGINNVSTGKTGGTILLSFGEHINIPLGINNDALNGAGGEIHIEAHAPAGFSLGQHVKLSNNAATDGGLISGSNAMGPLSINPSGLQMNSNGNGSHLWLSTIRESFENPSDITLSGAVINLDGKNNGVGGLLSMNADGSVVLSNSSISANGSGDSKGGLIGIGAWKAVSISDVNLVANGGSNGDGGAVSIDGATLAAKNLSITANGQGIGKGGWLSFYFSESADFAGSGTKAEARGANGGYLTVRSEGQVVVNNKWFNIAPIGGVSGAGNGGIIELVSFHGAVTTSGNFYVDGVDEGSGGELYIASEGDSSSVTLGSTGQSKYYARGGTSGGNGGRIGISVGGDLLVLDTAILDASVRGENGNGGTLGLSAGHSAQGGSLYVNKSLNVNGRGNGNGGNIGLDASTGDGGGGGPIGTFALVGPSDGPGLFISATLTANGAGIGIGGNIRAELRGGSGDLTIANNLNANGGTGGRGGEVYIESHNTLSIGTAEAPVFINARGGTSSGNGGFITIQGYSDMDLSHASLFADARGAGSGGSVLIAQNEAGGPVGSFAVGGSSLQSEFDKVFIIPIKVDATGSGDDTKGGGITVRTPGSIHFSRQGNVMTANGQALSLGGTISVNAAKDIIIDNGVILTSLATGGDADGGQINLNAGKSITINGTLNVTGHGSGAGGKVIIGDESSISSITVSRDILADGGATGNGGEINLKASGENAAITIGSAEQSKNLAARGGTDGGAGGNITLESAGDLILNGAFISTSTRAGSEKAGDITLKAGTAGSGRIQFTGDITASAVAAGDAGNVDISYSSADPLELGGHVYARATGSGKGGDISFNNASPTIKMTVNNTISADSKAGEDGTITFNKDSSLERNVELTGTGALEGKVEFLQAGSVEVNLTAANNNINLEKVESKGSHVSISAPSIGSKITIDSTAEIENSAGSITLKAPEITNNGTIKAKDFVEFSSDAGLKVKGNGSLNVTGGPGEVRVSAAAGKTLSFEGIQTFDAGGGKVIWSATGTGGFINVLENNSQNIGAGSSLEVVTPHIALRENVGLKTTNGGSISIDSGDANAVARLTAVNSGKTTTLTTSGGGGNISIKGAGVTLAGADSKLEMDTSSATGNGGKITLSATVENVQNSTDHLTLKSTGNIGGDIAVTSTQAAINLNKTDITADTLDGNLPTSEGGRISISAAKTVTLSGPIQSNSNHRGGAIEIIGSNIAVGNDPPNSPPLSLKANGENAGGTIKLTATTGNIDLTKFHTELGITGENGDGGTLEVVAPNGSLKFSGEISVNGKGTGSGGAIVLNAEAFNFSVIGNMPLSANAGSSGRGGVIKITASKQNINLGSGANRFDMSALGSDSSSGGEIVITSGKNLFFFGGIKSEPGLLSNRTSVLIELNAIDKLVVGESISIVDNSDRGHIKLTGNVIQIEQNVSLIASGKSSNRSITVEAKSGAQLSTISTVGNNEFSTADLRSDYGGTISLSSAGDIKLGSGSSISADGTFDGDAGKITVVAHGGNALLANAQISARAFRAAQSSGSGGIVHLEAKNTLTIPTSINASGAGAGNGGTILLMQDDSSPFFIGSLDTSKEQAGSSGGTISIEGKSDLNIRLYGSLATGEGNINLASDGNIDIRQQSSESSPSLEGSISSGKTLSGTNGIIGSASGVVTIDTPNHKLTIRDLKALEDITLTSKELNLVSPDSQIESSGNISIVTNRLSNPGTIHGQALALEGLTNTNSDNSRALLITTGTITSQNVFQAEAGGAVRGKNISFEGQNKLEGNWQIGTPSAFVDSILIDGNSIDGKKSSVSVVGTLSISANSKFTVQVGNALAVSGVGNLSIESPTIENHGTIDATANLTWRGPVAIGSPSRESIVYQTRGEAGILTADTILIETDTNLTFVNPLGDDALSKDLLHSTNNMSISASSVTFDGKTSRLTAGENIEMHINSILGSGSTLEAKNILISNKDVANISITNTNITAIDGKIVIQNKFERGIALNTANALSATGTTADGGRIYVVSGASLPIDPLTAGDTPGLYIGSPIDPIFEPTRAYHFNKFAGGGVVVAGQPNSIIFFGIQGTPTVPGAQTLFEVSGPPIPTAHNKNETMNIEGSSVPEFQPVSYIQECLLPGRSLQIQHTETASASYRLDLEKGQLKHLSESMIQLISGEIVIIAKRTTTILTENAEIRILPGSALFIKLSNEKCLEINILHADKRDGALVLIEKQKFLLSSGKRLVFRKSARNRLAASIARRCIQTVQLTDSSIELSEFSLLSLSQNSDILRWSLHQKADPVMRKCFKTAAALSMLFIKHGSYQK